MKYNTELLRLLFYYGFSGFSEIYKYYPQTKDMTEEEVKSFIRTLLNEPLNYTKL